MNEQVLRPSKIATQDRPFHDPEPFYRELRNTCPVSWRPAARSWLAVRHDDVARTLRDPKFEHTGILDPWEGLESRYGLSFPASVKVIRSMPFNYEGPVHANLRRRFAVAVTRFNNEDALFAKRARMLLDKLRGDGGFDFAADFANKLMFDVMCELAEIPESGRAVLLPLSHLSWTIEATISLRDRRYMNALAEAAHEMLCEEIPGIIERSPRSLLAHVYGSLPEDMPDRVSATALAMCVMLMMGNDAFGASMGFSMSWLLDPEQNKGQSIDQRQWAGLGDEMLRFHAPVDYLTRVVPENMEMAGVELKKGDWLMTSPFAANRDTDKFGPAADRISLDSKFGVALTFGAGRHLCVGMQLSRRVAKAAMEALAEFPTLSLAGEPRQTYGSVIRSMSSLPVSLG